MHSESSRASEVDLPRPRPAMRGPYQVRNPLGALALWALDAALATVLVRKPELPRSLGRILVANWGHLGDVVTTFGAIAALRRRFPGAEIGMIVGRWGSAPARSSGLVDRLHEVDHWRLDRSDRPGGEKKTRYAASRAAALEAIRRIGYEAAIDFYPFFPPAHPLFREARIPVRIGFTSGGFGPLLTHPVRWIDADRPVSDTYRDLVNMLTPEAPLGPGETRPMMPGPAKGVPVGSLQQAGRVAVLHPGSGAAFKDWGIENWIAFIRLARASDVFGGWSFVVTGAGSDEAAYAGRIAEACPEAVDLVGRLDWDQYVSVLAGAGLVVCPDTIASHVAALFDVPTVCIFTGTNNKVQWGPVSPKARVLLHPVPCAPCNRPGCAAMACIRNVTPREVLDAALEAVAQR